MLLEAGKTKIKVPTDLGLVRIHFPVIGGHILAVSWFGGKTKGALRGILFKGSNPTDEAFTLMT